MTTKINVDSSKNQDIKRKFVEREVITCVTHIVEYIISQSFEGKNDNIPFTYDDIENMYVPKCNNCGDFNSIEEVENEEGETVYKCSYCDNVTEEEPETEPQEVFEWWIVDSMLYEDLQKRGYVVLDDGFHKYWGRTTTGQAILLDGVISEICMDMKILEGQENEWKV